ncbi:MAG TPA: hypothetical protein VF780_01825 [Nitrosospira sp.]
MKKNSEAMRRHKAYLRAKTALRDQHQDDYALILERHAQELDALWADWAGCSPARGLPGC